jgi:branched-chain amino acid transport system ATP-binding protein
VSAPLLEVKGVTVRFGGLTAVSAVDLAVEPGRVVAVIGPNGAGKTTLFNAISGLIPPTEGQVHFAGSDLQRPFVPRHALTWALTGLSVGIVMLLLASNLEGLWTASVKDNFRAGTARFSPIEALGDALGHLGAAPRIEQRGAVYHVCSHDGAITFGPLPSAHEAAQKLRDVEVLGTLDPRTAIVGEGAELVARAADGRVLERAQSRDELTGRIAAAREMRASARQAIVLRVLAFLAGAFIGVAGAWAIWRRSRWTPVTVTAAGIARTFQNIRLFQQMTVVENVVVALDAATHDDARAIVRRYAPPATAALLLAATAWVHRSGSGLALLPLGLAAGVTLGWLVRISRLGAFSAFDLSRERQSEAQALELLARVGLQGSAGNLARNLSYGDQRRLEIARALATHPRLLLLDEPAAGMNPSEKASLMKLVRDICDSGVTVVLIEHDMPLVMGVSDHIAVLHYGRKIAEGPPEAIRNNPQVIEAYLGTEAVAGAT